MADMRVVIAGAGGRMGRTLIHAIAATKGLALAGAVDAPGSAVIGRDAGEARGFVVGQGGAPRQHQDSDGGKPSSIAHRVHSCRGRVCPLNA